MDGVQELVGVTVVAATNRPDVIVSDKYSVTYKNVLIASIDRIRP